MEIKTGKELEEALKNSSIEELKTMIRFMSQTQQTRLVEIERARKSKDEYDIKFIEVATVLKRDYKKSNDYLRKQASEVQERSERWEGRYYVIKHENNMLRKKLKKQ